MKRNREKPTRQRIFSPALPPVLTFASSAVGYEEHRGRFGGAYDFHDDSDLFGADTWEHAEKALGYTTLNLLLAKAKMSPDDIDLVFAGDLQNQCVASAEGLLPTGIPFLGLYGACSTAVEGLLLGTMALNANPCLQNCAIVTTSHHCAAERQFRLPLEYGGQRTPTAQWTATAGGAFLLTRGEPSPGVESAHRSLAADGALLHAPRITAAMPGRMVDGGVSDAANMGAAMAPAAADSLLAFFAESGTSPADFDKIVTGDLGREGSEILREILRVSGVDLGTRHEDCGDRIYLPDKQDAHAGGSGCGCCAAVMAAHYLPLLRAGKLRRILFMATGALMSPSSIQQRGHILGIAPIVVLEGET